MVEIVLSNRDFSRLDEIKKKYSSLLPIDYYLSQLNQVLMNILANPINAL